MSIMQRNELDGWIRGHRAAGRLLAHRGATDNRFHVCGEIAGVEGQGKGARVVFTDGRRQRVNHRLDWTREAS